VVDSSRPSGFKVLISCHLSSQRSVSNRIPPLISFRHLVTSWLNCRTCCLEISIIFTIIVNTGEKCFSSVYVSSRDLKFMWYTSWTVQPKNNARTRSGARSSCAGRARKPPQEVKVLCFCGLPARTFETQQVENLAARSRKKLLMLPRAVRSWKKYCGSSGRNL